MNLEDQAVALGLAYALTEVAKGTGMPTRFAPVFSLVAGIAVVLILSTEDIRRSIVYGLIAGLSASGAYSGTKAVVKKT